MQEITVTRYKTKCYKQYTTKQAALDHEAKCEKCRNKVNRRHKEVFYKPAGTTRIRSYPNRKMLADYLGVTPEAVSKAIRLKSVTKDGFLIANTAEELR